MGALMEGIGVEPPIVQAGMGGGLAGAELADVVSAAGGLGTIGILGPDDLRREIAAARERTDGPVSVNLLLPLPRRPHFEAAAEADVVVTFWAKPRRRIGKVWIHQIGSVPEALAARDSGADAEAVVCGTRFLMSEESGAHLAYKARLSGAKETVLTELFGLGWPAPHRVVPNAATERWLRNGRRGPESLVDAGPLYAGECIERIDDVRLAAALVRELAP
jgi:nitronate monooxygenase